MTGFGFRVSGFGFRDSGFGFRVSSFGNTVQGFGFRGKALGFRDRCLHLGMPRVGHVRLATIISDVQRLPFRDHGQGFGVDAAMRLP